MGRNSFLTEQENCLVKARGWTRAHFQQIKESTAHSYERGFLQDRKLGLHHPDLAAPDSFLNKQFDLCIQSSNATACRWASPPCLPWGKYNETQGMTIMIKHTPNGVRVLNSVVTRSLGHSLCAERQPRTVGNEQAL